MKKDKKSDDFEKKIFLYNISIPIMFVVGIIVGFLVNQTAVIFMPLGWMIVSAVIADIFEWKGKMIPDGWLAAIQAVWNY